jgi:hypothetical protein
MLIVRVTTENPLRVSQKFASKPARLLAVTCSDKSFTMLYALDEWDDYNL